MFTRHLALSAHQWARCFNCGTAVALLRITPTERTHTAPLDIADTVTCPGCGIDIPAVAEETRIFMSMLDAIYQRRSVRSYTTEPVDRDTVQRLLDAAVRAPSARNTQPWAFAIVQNAQRLRRYAERTKRLYLAEPPPAALANIPRTVLRHFRDLFASPAYDVFHGAGTLVVIYAVAAEGVPDCYLAAENLMLTACAMGLGTCPIGLARPCLEEPDIRAELGVPAGMVVALPIVVGVPAADSPPVDRHPARVISWS